MSPESSVIRTRLAPSPTGDPHVGTAYIGLFDYVFARSQGGKFVLRIEDTDRIRSTPESEAAILRALRWVGLQWDEGPEADGPCAPYRQSERSPLYREAADDLIAKGAAYRCFCTPERLAALREEQKTKKLDFGYDGLCRALDPAEAKRRADAGEAHVVRLAVPKDGETAFDDLIRGRITVENRAIDDQVLLKSDGFPTYHLANVVDDHLMGITHVIRAEEWIASTPKHILLYAAFGRQPPAFAHMPLLRNADRSKISKRKNPTSLEWYRDEGFLPEALINFLGLMGWSFGDDREIFTVDDLIREFRWEQVGKGAPVFDLRKLEWLNGEYIRALPTHELTRRLREIDSLAATLDDATVLGTIPLVQERLKRLTDYSQLMAFAFADDVAPDPRELVARKHTAAETAEALERVIALCEAAADWAPQPLEDACRALAGELDWKVGVLFMPIRIAVTGTNVSPPLFESMGVLGREKSLARLRAAVDLLRKQD